MATIALPTVKTAPTKLWRRQKFLMLGPSGIGKSEFWAQGDKTLFLEFEPRLDHLSVLKVAVRSWDDFIASLDLLYKEAQKVEFPYDTVVVDTGDKYYERVTESVLDWAQDKYKKLIDKGQSIDAIGDVPEGTGWYRVTTMAMTGLDKLTALPAAIVIICHIKEETIKEAGSEYKKATVSLGGQMGTRLLGWSDHTLHVRARYVGDTIHRNVRTIPSQLMEAKSSGGIVPDGMVWTKDAKLNYTNFRNLFDG